MIFLRLAALQLLWTTMVFASEADRPPVLDIEEQEYLPLESEIPFDLDTLTVTGERMSIRHEAGFRMLRQALNQKPSSRKEDIDVVVCWYERPIGTRMRYLMCGRNGDLWSRNPDNRLNGVFAGNRPVPGYGKIMRSAQPVNPRRVDRVLNSLPGSGELDAEFVAMAFSGEKPPQDIPDSAELDQFARAYLAVETLSQSGADDDALEAAIVAEGMTLNRYNRLVDLFETYQSLENEAADRLHELTASK